MMRVVVVVAALVAVLVGCAPRDPVAYAQMVCGDPDQGLLLGSDEHVVRKVRGGECPKRAVGDRRCDAGTCESSARPLRELRAARSSARAHRRCPGFKAYARS